MIGQLGISGADSGTARWELRESCAYAAEAVTFYKSGGKVGDAAVYDAAPDSNVRTLMSRSSQSTAKIGAVFRTKKKK